MGIESYKYSRTYWPASKAISLRTGAQTEEEKTSSHFDADWGEIKPVEKEAFIKIRVRNQKAVQALKKLYGKCQITGSKFVFKKTDGKPYLEVHHLVPLGKGGSDKFENLIVVSAHMHRMLHYANVTGLKPSKMSSGNELKFKINGDAHIIRWKREHANIIKGGK